jgi:hypothetical protein
VDATAPVKIPLTLAFGGWGVSSCVAYNAAVFDRVVVVFAAYRGVGILLVLVSFTALRRLRRQKNFKPS